MKVNVRITRGEKGMGIKFKFVRINNNFPDNR